MLLLLSAGCSAIPEVRHGVRVHNPFPQLKTVAILPFFNQSNEPTLDAGSVTEAYYAALQAVPGFEVLPVGVSQRQLEAYAAVYGPPQTGQQFQAFARLLGVDAVVQGAVTDYDPYYPPRMGLTVHWYAANPSFHPIPVGYGLPWGTEAEEDIPSEVVLEAEFELARQQLATQTPPLPADSPPPAGSPPAGSPPGPPPVPQGPPQPPAVAPAFAQEPIASLDGGLPAALPAAWPDPSGLIPDGPQPFPPPPRPQHDPVLTHTRLYDGSDSRFTRRLADHVSAADDRRPTNWQAYLSRTDDFVRFCCHLHVTEMLEARGGADQSDLILNWPIGRYRSQ
ncbi:hypothetical protein [Roseimaritima sediminicola]|uniref:hypothetical protein n=1 Tax=Roseimaritima sediminicola TaxID=2662066 RepID=UPI00129856C4|nr:hypothetical protein [Roseimaritima sediminicola]